MTSLKYIICLIKGHDYRAWGYKDHLTGLPVLRFSKCKRCNKYLKFNLKDSR